uniref:Uncharacterized protein n=1 Tax=Lotus japonicus TaxID=34305 RepID=I3SCN2_LOTJA|nr:unknown [Lotus japonicus]
MVKFSDLSDTEDSAINEIISQAQDACLLDQLAAINCAGVTDSVLPPDLDSRFRKLKSLPANRTTPPTFNAKARSFSTLSSRTLNKTVMGSDQSPNFSPPKNDPEPDEHTEKVKSKSKPKHGSVSASPPSGSSHTSEESSISSLFRSEGKGSKQRTLFSPSPPRMAGCFGCSPKKKKKKKSKENVVGGWDQSDELFSDLGGLSLSKQRKKMLKMAMKEEEKVSREAEKIVEWAKSVSARMNISDIEDELSDD